MKQKTALLIGMVISGVIVSAITARQNARIKKETDEMVKKSVESLNLTPKVEIEYEPLPFSGTLMPKDIVDKLRKEGKLLETEEDGYRYFTE